MKFEKWIPAFAGMTMFLLVGASCAFADSARKAILAEIQGPVEVKMGEEWQRGLKGMVLDETHEVKTGPEGYAEIFLDDEAQTGKLELMEKSHLRLSSMKVDKMGDKVTYLDLALGKVMVHAEKLQGDSKFEVRTPNASAGVRGTVFEVSVDEEV